MKKKAMIIIIGCILLLNYLPTTTAYEGKFVFQEEENCSITISTGQAIAQKFVSKKEFNPTKIYLKVTWVDGSNNGFCFAGISENVDTNESNWLTYTIKRVNEINDDTWDLFDEFYKQDNVEKGKEYYLIFKTEMVNNHQTEIDISTSDNNPYPNGEMKYYPGELPWGYYQDNLDYDLTFKIYGDATQEPPNKPSTPSGSSTVNTGKSYTYSTSTTDPDDDEIKYGLDWDGDNIVDEWSNYYQSGEECTMTHTWYEPGSYNVKVQAMDEKSLSSTWSDPLKITVSRPLPPLDLAVVSRGNNEIIVLQGDGNGNFNNQRSFSTVENPEKLKSGDFNNDGLSDLAVVGDDLSILINKGNGFERKDVYLEFNQIKDMAIGDFNNDNRLDLAISDEGKQAEQSIIILRGDGYGNFRFEKKICSICSWWDCYPHILKTVDVNKDGNMDIICGIYQSYMEEDIGVLLGDGNFDFSIDTYSLGSENEILDFDMGDINNDGNIDIVAASRDYSSKKYIKIFLGDTEGKFTLDKTIRPSGQYVQIYRLLVKDISNDNNLDIIYTSLNDVNTLLGNGNGEFVDYIINSKCENLDGIVIEDFDNNGWKDWAMTCDRGVGHVVIRLRSGNNNYDKKDYQAGKQLREIVTGDFGDYYSNNPPNKPQITGPTSGKAGEECTYTISTTDPDGDNIYYYIEWGDDDAEGWMGPYNSGEGIELNHIFGPGYHTIRAKAKDTNQLISDVGTLGVEMPKEKCITSVIFHRLFENFPILMKLINNLFPLK